MIALTLFPPPKPLDDTSSGPARRGLDMFHSAHVPKLSSIQESAERDLPRRPELNEEKQKVFTLNTSNTFDGRSMFPKSLTARPRTSQQSHPNPPHNHNHVQHRTCPSLLSWVRPRRPEDGTAARLLVGWRENCRVTAAVAAAAAARRPEWEASLIHPGREHGPVNSFSLSSSL